MICHFKMMLYKTCIKQGEACWFTKFWYSFNNWSEYHKRKSNLSWLIIAEYFCEKYYKFPIKKDYAKLATWIGYYLMKSALQTIDRSKYNMNQEQSHYQTYCKGNNTRTYQKNYAKAYIKCLCKLCQWKCEIGK